jgi:hypothetical protein
LPHALIPTALKQQSRTDGNREIAPPLLKLYGRNAWPSRSNFFM